MRRYPRSKVQLLRSNAACFRQSECVVVAFHVYGYSWPVTIWAEHDVEARILEVLGDVPTTNDAHHFGRPYMSAYQLAIELHRRYPAVAKALGRPVGGAGVGRRNSLAQYLAKQLSDRNRDDDHYPVEGAFITNQDVLRLSYQGPDGAPVTSSLTGSGFELSLFRLRDNGL